MPEVAPLAPFVPQFFVTLFALLAPQLTLLLLVWLVIPWYLVLLGFGAALWRLSDPIGRQVWPCRRLKVRKLCGVYGGSHESLDVCRSAVRQVAKTYKPTPWLWSGDQRTVALGVSNAKGVEPLDVHKVPGPRGSNLIVQTRAPAEKGLPIVFVLGGLVGDPSSPFVVDVQKGTKSQGWGFGVWCTSPDYLEGSIADAPNPQEVGDVHACLEFMRKRFAGSPVFLVGYSLGGNWVNTYCARYGGDALCDGAVAAAGAFQSDLLTWYRYKRYWQPWLAANLKALFWKRFEKELPPREVFAKARVYDEIIELLPHVRPLSTFCERAFAGADKAKIAKPLLFFASADDPFHPIDLLGIDVTLPYVLYYITQVGGHVAWPEGWGANCKTFHVRVVMTFFAALVKK